MPTSHIGHKHAHTLQQVFQHPASHNLQWHDVIALVKESGTVHEEENGRLTCMLNGVSEVFHPSRDKKDVSDVQQVMDIRHFLERAGFKKDGSIAQPNGAEADGAVPQLEHHAHDHGRVNAEQNRHAEQKLKTQEHEQNDRSGFMPGDAQAHQQSNRQK